MGDPIKTVTRAAAGVFTLGLSEVIGGAFQKSTPQAPLPSKTTAKVDETKVEVQEKNAERKRRQLIARTNMNIKTSPLGADINQGLLGGTSLTGQ